MVSAFSHLSEGKFVPVHDIKACRFSRYVTPLFLDLSTRWRGVVGFIAHPLYSNGKNTLYQWCTQECCFFFGGGGFNKFS